MFYIGVILKIYTFMAVTTHAIKKGNKTWSCVELLLKMVLNLSDTDIFSPKYSNWNLLQNIAMCALHNHSNILNIDNNLCAEIPCGVLCHSEGCPIFSHEYGKLNTIF